MAKQEPTTFEQLIKWLVIALILGYLFASLTACNIGKDVQQDVVTMVTVHHYEYAYRDGEKRLIVWIYVDREKRFHTIDGLPLADTLTFPIGRSWQQLVKL